MAAAKMTMFWTGRGPQGRIRGHRLEGYQLLLSHILDFGNTQNDHEKARKIKKIHFVHSIWVKLVFKLQLNLMKESFIFSVL